MNDGFSVIIEILGTVAFTVSGAFSAMQKRMDIFGVFVLGFVTAIGGGTLRDILIGSLPVAWMRDMQTPLIILGTTIATIIFKKYVKNLKITLFLFDALGLGLFTIIGVQKGLNANLNPGACVALGTITGCFGGVVRDILINEIPVLFRKEIYATACIAGGCCYLLLLMVADRIIAETAAIFVICTIRIIAMRRNWKLPSV
ncbi:MAG: trimeric intracellular cation channel family protein [Bacteroidota bacterium]